MRRALLVISLLAASASIAPAHVTPYSWTAARANVMLPDAVTIALPADVKASLQAELTPLIERFRLLELIAQQERGDWLAAGTYANYVKRLRDARERVQKGLPLDTPRCAGSGRAVKGKRFTHFRCEATSYVLEVPTVELREGEVGALPQAIEGEIRRFGPYRAVFVLHVTGPGKLFARRLS